MKNEHIINTMKRYLQALIGMFILAVAFNFFILPHDFVYGGLSGLSIITQRIFDIEPSLFIFVTSVLLLVLSYITLGTKKTAASVFGTLLFPILVKLTSNINNLIPFNNEQPLLYAVFGGVLSGIGLGLTYKAGFTSGGTDIVAQIASKYLKINMGKGIAICDGLILLLGTFIFGINNFMYAVIILYFISNITDKVLLGISDSKAFYIFTEKDKEVKEYILKQLGHGVTIFNAKGGYKDEEQEVLFCVIPTKEYIKLKDGIKGIDKNAFFIVTDSYEVYGGE